MVFARCSDKMREGLDESVLGEVLERGDGLVIPSVMTERMAIQTERWSHLKSMAEPVPTAVQRFLKQCLDAGDREPLVVEVLCSAFCVHQLVVETLPKPIGADHEFKLLLSALAMTTLLLDEAATTRLYEALPVAQHWLVENGMERIAIGLDVGGGKTGLAVGLFGLAYERLQEDPKQLGPMARGCLYTASSVSLLCAFRDRLVAAGVPEEAIGLIYSAQTAKEKKPRYPCTPQEDCWRYPLLLCSQSMVQGASARDLCPDARHGLFVDDVLLYRQRRRAVVWDESFNQCISDSLSLLQLREVAALLEQAAEPPAMDDVPICTLQQCHSVGTALRKLASAVSVSSKAAGRQVRRAAVWIPPVVVDNLAMLTALKKVYEHRRNEGHAEAVESLMGMTAAGGLDPLVGGGKGDRMKHLIRPRVVVSEKFTRLAVLDASFSTSKVAAMEKSLRLPAFEDVAGKELAVKTYENVTVYFYAGFYGRSAMKREGLDHPAERRRVIREAVRRALRTPDERALFATFNTRLGGPDFVGEIEAELDRRAPGWRKPVAGSDGSEQPFHNIVTWGNHRGENCYMDCTNVLTVGLLTRTWMSGNAGSSARTELAKATHGDEDAINSAKANEVETDLLVSEIIQVAGRGAMRITVDGKASRMNLHVTYKERVAPFIGMAPCPGSPMWEEIKRRLPGVRLVSDDTPQPMKKKPRPRGFRQRAADAVVVALGKLPVEMTAITSRELRHLVEAELPEEKRKELTANALSDAMKMADKAIRDALERGEIKNGWIRPSSSRTWVRATQTELGAEASDSS